MQWDREKPANRVKQQEELLREYVLHHVYPYSPFYRRRFDGAKLSAKNVSTMADLAKLEPIGWSDVTSEAAAFVLRPTERAIARFGDRRLVMAIAKAKLRGKVAQLNRDVIDPAYKPIHWHLVDDVPIGYSAGDIEHLGEAGSRMLQLADLHRDDVIVSLIPPGPNMAYWQLVDGARKAGISAIHLGPGVSLDRLRASAPTALAGSPDDLERVLRALESTGGHLPGLRTLLALGSPLGDAGRDALQTVGRFVGEDDLEVMVSWAPLGVRALWAECRGGRGFHTYPDLEWLEVLDDGEVAWTSLAWHGTVFLRLRTGMQATVEDVACETCGRIGPKLVVQSMVAPEPAPAAAFAPSEAPRAAVTDGLHRLAVLDEHPAVAAWAAELRSVEGVDELIVFVAPAGVDRLGPLFRDLDATLRATQYVLARPEQVQERVARDGRVLDLR